MICSPKAAKSRWVNEEILTFKRLGREHRIFCLIVAGEPGASANPEPAEHEVLPERADLQLGADGKLTTERSEPIAADVRPRKDGKHDALLKLLAGMLGIGLDELKRREARRRHRRMVALVSASVAGMVITSALATTRLACAQRGRAAARASRRRRPRPRGRPRASWSTCSRSPIRARRSATPSPRARSSTRARRASRPSSPTSRPSRRR